MASRLIDITRRLDASTPTWPGDAPFALRWTSGHSAGAAASQITLSPHLGTHLDAPLHLVPGGADAASVDLTACIGPCHVVEPSTADGVLTPGDLPPGWRPHLPRVLLATRAWPNDAAFPAAFPGLSVQLVDALADAGVVLVGVDTPSVDPLGSRELPAHRRCLARGLLIIEGLALEHVRTGEYALVALPLRLVGVEASPVRAVLAPLHG